ncbi:hypothetical protein B0T16DRAFT_456016 [Cercophora newfieldiana]|uniref:Uncharacterized protein n=1 Tax=Cercophora newfieldiana TaxID=92897 RepID=A0AA40CS04_9PEZI|nr:hypothetical protein B0T16DRAFT_456016 [Cercophora newfieldiana]
MPAAYHHSITFIGTLLVILTTVALSIFFISGLNFPDTPLHLVIPSSKQQQDHDPPPAPPSHCGNTTTTARALGCHFDPMSFSWLPAPCYDAELTTQFLGFQPWQWFSSPEGLSANTTSARRDKEEVPREDVLRGENEYLYVSWEYHKLHCTYMWRKMHRAVLGMAEMDGYIGNYHHTEHCEEILTRQGMGDEDGSKGLTVIRRKFVSCGFGLPT